MDAKLFAYLSYSDAPAALEWLQAVGFGVIQRQDGPAGTVLHAEISMGEAVIMVASSDAASQRPPLIGQSTGQGLYLLVEDVDAFHQKALAAGGTSVTSPKTPNGAPGAAGCSIPKDRNGAPAPTSPE